jgi:hypothetical protein
VDTILTSGTGGFAELGIAPRALEGVLENMLHKR